MTLEEKKQRIDTFIGKKVNFLISDVTTHQTIPQEFTLKHNEINTHLDMVISYFEEASPRFFINSEVLYYQENNVRKTIF